MVSGNTCCCLILIRAPPLWVPDFDFILPSGANPSHLSAPTTNFFLRAITYPQAHPQSSLIKLRLFCNSQKRCFQAYLLVWCVQFQCLLSTTVQVTVTILPRSACQSMPYPDLKWPLKCVLSGELRSIQWDKTELGTVFSFKICQEDR